MKKKTKGGTINDDYEKSFYLKNFDTKEYLIILSDKRFVNKYKMIQENDKIYICDSGNESNQVIYSRKDKTYSFKDIDYDENYFEQVSDIIIRDIISKNEFILELIDKNNSKQKNFEDKQNIREKLCDKMVEHVLSKKDKVNSNEDWHNHITCPKVNNIDPKVNDIEYLGEDLCEFFTTLDIYTKKIRYNDGDVEVKFVLREIFLKTEDLAGGRLAYAIIQGIKMGIILLNAMDINKKYIFAISTPLAPMQSYLNKIENLKSLDSSGIYIGKCQDDKHFYWKYNTDKLNYEPESISRFEGNGKFPLIIAGKEPIFAPGTATANAIKDHIISLIIKNMNNIKDTPFDFIDDLLVQTVFDKFIITNESNNLKIEFKYKQMFIRIDILNNVINELMQKHYGILISNRINSINGKILSNYRKVIGHVNNVLLNMTNMMKKIGGNKGKKEYKKDILGNLRCIYKIPGDRKEYVKHNGMLITVKNYKDIISSKKKIKKYKRNNI